MIVGIDSLRVAVPLGGWQTDAPPTRYDGRGNLVLLDGKARARLQSVTGVGLAYVEASLPKVLLGSNVDPLPYERMREAIETILRDLGRHLVVDDAREAALRVLRVDLVRDFEGVIDHGLLLRGLETTPRNRCYHGQLHSHGGEPETLTFGVHSWSITLYDKHAESKGVAPKGRLRCEVRLRERRLGQKWTQERGGAIRVVSDISEDRMEQLARASFDLAGLGSRVVSKPEALRRASELPLKPQERAALMLVLECDGGGLRSGFDAKTVRKYRKLARDNGLQIRPDESRTEVWLDWDAGVGRTVEGRASGRAA